MKTNMKRIPDLIYPDGTSEKMEIMEIPEGYEIIDLDLSAKKNSFREFFIDFILFKIKIKKIMKKIFDKIKSPLNTSNGFTIKTYAVGVEETKEIKEAVMNLSKLINEYAGISLIQRIDLEVNKPIIITYLVLNDLKK
jgi:hypothetical protein